MAKLNVPPTKSNLLRLKRELVFAIEGYEMLDQKRQILVLELIGMVESAKRSQGEVQEKLARAHAALREALLQQGSRRVAVEASAEHREHSVEVETRSLMGITLATVTPEHPELAPSGGMLSGSAAFDEAAIAFNEALQSIDRLAEIENAVFRLAREVRKTVRRVNALDKMFIPAYRETLGFIGGVLDERERDEFIVMRMVKARLEKKRSESTKVG